MQLYKGGHTNELPRRPELLFLSDMRNLRDARPMGKVLILDEAHAIRDSSKRTYRTIQAFRQQFEGCVMLTSTPHEKNWIDVYALVSLLKDHPFKKPEHMMQTFTAWYETEEKKRKHLAPEGDHLRKFTKAMEAFILRVQA